MNCIPRKKHGCDVVVRGNHLEGNHDDGRIIIIKEAYWNEIRKRSGTSLESIHKFLSDDNLDPNIPDTQFQNNRGLHYATKYGNTRLLNILLQAGADPNVTNKGGLTPLMVACRGEKSSHSKCVQRLLQVENCDIEAKDNEGGTALRHAIKSSNVETVRSLLKKKVDLNWETEFTYGDESCVVALSFAKSVRAMKAGIEQHKADGYFAKQQQSKNSILPWIMRKGIYSSSNMIVEAIENSLCNETNQNLESNKFRMFYRFHLRWKKKRRLNIIEV